MSTSGVVNGVRSQWEQLPKVLLHEHLDCSLRPATMLEMWSRGDFESAPKNFPRRCVDLWRKGNTTEAVAEYQSFMTEEASASLAQYLSAIVHHVSPLMQSAENLTRFTRERMEDAHADGVVALHLRFAPQLHVHEGLSLTQVMDAVIAGITGAPLDVRLVLCTLRHEDVVMARQLSDLARHYRDYVSLVDLAGDEHAFPGVLEWWAAESVKVREAGIDLTIHLWETDDPVKEDLARLEKFSLQRLGHGFRGDLQSDRLLEVCPSSNVVTGQVKDFGHHPIDKLFSQGRRVTVNTDGTLFTGSDLTNEYMLLNSHFGWGSSQFSAVNQTALEASLLPSERIAELSALIANAYGSSFLSPQK